MPDDNPTLPSGIFFLWNRTADYANKNRCDEQKETKGTKAVEVGKPLCFLGYLLFRIFSGQRMNCQSGSDLGR